LGAARPGRVRSTGPRQAPSTTGRPRRRPDTLLADRGYDSQPHRQALGAHGIRPIIGKRRTEHGSGLGTQRWVVERTLSWLHSSDASAPATNAAPISTKPSSASPAASSAMRSSRTHFVRRS
jgi:transposase